MTIVFNKRDIRRRISVVSNLRTLGTLSATGCRTFPLCVSGSGQFCINSGLQSVTTFQSVSTYLGTTAQILPTPTSNCIRLIHCPVGGFNGPIITNFSITVPIIRNAGIRSNALVNLLRVCGIPCTTYSIASSTLNVSGFTVGTMLTATNVPILRTTTCANHNCTTSPRNVLSTVRTEFNCPIVIGPIGLNSSMNVSGTDSHTTLASTVSLTIDFTSQILIRQTIPRLQRVGYTILNSDSRTHTSTYRRPLGTRSVLAFSSGCVDNGGGSNNSGNVASLGHHYPTRLPRNVARRIRRLTIGAFGTLKYLNITHVSFLGSGRGNRL